MLSYYLSDLTDMIGEYLVQVIIVAAIIGILDYLYSAFTLRAIASKVGLRKPWMAFVPVANTIYWLQIAGEPWWKLFFLDPGGALITGVIALPLVAPYLLYGALWIVIYVVAILYALFCLYITITWRSQYYRTFGINPLLTLADYLPGAQVVAVVVEGLLAYTHLFDPDRAEQSTHAAPAPAVHNGRFIGIAGEYNTAVFELTDGQEMVLGRDPSQCSVVFSGAAAAAIGRKHCSVRYSAAENAYIITDYSKNGTFDGQGNRLPTSAKLYSGATFYLADRQNMFRLG